MPSPYQSLERARGRREQSRENSGGRASAWGQVSTTGWGELAHGSVIDFQITFIAEPMVAYGYSCQQPLTTTRYPRAHGFVYSWRRDQNGYYTGAWVATVVETQGAQLYPSVPDPNYTLTHSFTFSGVAYKALPQRVGADLPG
jgi:hypothetical protein